MRVTKEEYAVLRDAALSRLIRDAATYGVPLAQYIHVNLQHKDKEEAIEWQITVLAYGHELHPGAGVGIA